MPRPVHFDIAADDPKRAIKFYESVFGWTFSKWDGPMEYNRATPGSDSEPGINGGISARGQTGMPNMNTIGVPDVEKFSATVQSNGGKIIQSKMLIPGVGWFAVAQDTEGNTFGMMQPDTNAK